MYKDTDNPEWPNDNRIDIIGHNGATGEHYQKDKPILADKDVGTKTHLEVCAQHNSQAEALTGSK